MLVPYVLTNLEKIILMTYAVAYIHSLDIIITKQTTRFIVSVLANIFISALPNSYMYRKVNLGSKLNIKDSKIYMKAVN